MIIFGTRRRSRLLATQVLVCQHCHNRAAQRLYEWATWFTLFFLPVFPFGVHRTYSCAYCGASTEVDRETADRFVADAQRAGSGAGAPAV